MTVMFDCEVVEAREQTSRSRGKRATGHGTLLQYNYYVLILWVDSLDPERHKSSKDLLRILSCDRYRCSLHHRPGPLVPVSITSNTGSPSDTYTFIMDHLVGIKLLTKAGGTPKATSDLLQKKELVLLYFSASWCPPCKAFSPILVDFYKKHAIKEKMEIIYVSSDRTIPDFEAYYSKMPWLSIPTEEGSAQIKQALAAKLGIQGIPSLIVLDAKTGEFISATAREDVTKASSAASAGTDLIAQWKQAPRLPLSEALAASGGDGGGNIVLTIIKWFMKNPMSIFAIMYLYRYVKKMYAPPVDPYEDVEPVARGGGPDDSEF
jgi:nucleoredoxin